MGNDLQTQLDAFKGAPLTYIAALIVVGLVIWAVCKFLYGHRIDGLKEELDRERRDNARLKEQLSSPVLHDQPRATKAAESQKLSKVVTAERPKESVPTLVKSGRPDPKGRVFLRENIDSVFLRSIYKRETEHHADQMIKPYIGKWMVIEGPVKDVSPSGEGWGVRIDTSAPNDFGHTSLYFEKSETPKIEILRKGDIVKAEGRLESANSMWIILRKAKLLDA